MERLSIRSFLANGHEYHLYVYGEVAGIPPGTVVKDGNELLPASEIFRCKEYLTFALFSDFFRYKLLLEKGGWWCDLDVVCLKFFDFSEDHVFATQYDLLGSDTAERITEVATNGIIKAPRRSEVLNYAWSVCSSKDRQALRWGDTGPELMQECVRKFSLANNVRRASTFCPIPPVRFFDALLPNRWLRFDEETYAVHLWHEMWRRNGIDVNEAYVSNCCYERLKTIYLP